MLMDQSSSIEIVPENDKDFFKLYVIENKLLLTNASVESNDWWAIWHSGLFNIVETVWSLFPAVKQLPEAIKHRVSKIELRFKVILK